MSIAKSRDGRGGDAVGLGVAVGSRIVKKMTSLLPLADGLLVSGAVIVRPSPSCDVALRGDAISPPWTTPMSTIWYCGVAALAAAAIHTTRREILARVRMADYFWTDGKSQELNGKQG
jgi:hypothetical protein